MNCLCIFNTLILQQNNIDVATKHTETADFYTETADLFP